MSKIRILQLVVTFAILACFLSPTHAANQEENVTPMLSLLLFSGKDCNGVKEGTAYLDLCNICVGGNTGNSPCYEEVTSATGRIWLDRNLGASRVATSSRDSAAYGDLYQWGRPRDGHQLRTSTTSFVASGSDTPGHGDFIAAPLSPKDWREPQNDTLWQGLDGTNPCPQGFRLPTEEELDAEKRSWGSGNKEAAAFASPLKFVVAGKREWEDGTFYTTPDGFYWSSTVDGSDARYLIIMGDFAFIPPFTRASGMSVRCIKN